MLDWSFKFEKFSCGFPAKRHFFRRLPQSLLTMVAFRTEEQRWSRGHKARGQGQGPRKQPQAFSKKKKKKKGLQAISNL